MKRVSAIFKFEQTYEIGPFSKDSAFVILTINYIEKTFSITPPSNGKSFTFSQSSKDYKKWLAVLDCIKQAIGFANEEIGVTNKPVSI